MIAMEFRSSLCACSCSSDGIKAFGTFCYRIKRLSFGAAVKLIVCVAFYYDFFLRELQNILVCLTGRGKKIDYNGIRSFSCRGRGFSVKNNLISLKLTDTLDLLWK